MGAGAIRACDFSLREPARQATQKRRKPRVGDPRLDQTLFDAGKRGSYLAMDPHGIAQKAYAQLLGGNSITSVSRGHYRLDTHPAGILVRHVDRKNGNARTIR
jgi:hypothetical protein